MAFQFRVDTPADGYQLIHTLQQIGCQHRIPLVQALLDGRIAHFEAQRVGHGKVLKQFLALVKKPALALIGDDNEAPTGPQGWQQAERLMRWARIILIHATGAEREHYEAAVWLAEAAGRVLLIECGSQTVEAWKMAATRWAPGAIKRSMEPAGGVHPIGQPAPVLQ